MIGRIILALVFVGSLVWIGFVGFDILSVKNNFAPHVTFGIEDQAVFVVNRPSEVQFVMLDEFSNSPLLSLCSDLNPDSYSTGYFSLNRPHFILKNSENWSKEIITSLFNKTGLELEIIGSEFTLGDYDGKFFKSSLYLSSRDLQSSLLNLDKNSFQVDKKSSLSIVQLNEDGVKSISDIYFLPSGKINYVSTNNGITLGNQVKDEVIFSSVVTSKFSGYHFRERDFLASTDSVFAKGPMAQWCLSGVLEIDYKGSRVLISDYVDGQDPILILNDLFQSFEESQFNVALTNDFPSKNSSFHIKYLEDLIVISESESACDKVIGDFKLGNTIALNQNVMNMVYGRLPKSISERFISETESYSKTVFKDKILQTKFGTSASKKEVVQKETISINCGFDISNFLVLEGNGNVVVQGEKGELAIYKNEEQIWKETVEGKIVGDIQLIDLYYNGEKFILFNTADKIYLYDLSGVSSSGFPVEIEDEVTNEVKFYRWLGKSYFLVGLEENQVGKFDGKGRELEIIKTQVEVKKKIDVWASQGKLFGGFSNGKNFEMYNLERKKSHRVFSLPSQTHSAKIPNELIQFALTNGQLIKIDQKGEKVEFESYENGKILSVDNTSKSPIVIIKSNNVIHLINNEGLSFGQIKVPFNEVENVAIYNSQSGKTFAAIIDGLENNVYLYDINGEKIKDKALEGQTKVSVVKSKNRSQVSTIIDQFFVQYFE
ncbi:MAG: hypothetical protein KC454_00845 [Flavobacteriales bacterium]|nr:hypothetical protein [Flavobacteriales bacterium]